MARGIVAKPIGPGSQNWTWQLTTPSSKIDPTPCESLIVELDDAPERLRFIVLVPSGLMPLLNVVTLTVCDVWLDVKVSVPLVAE
jgi:hypothetical protein